MIKSKKNTEFIAFLILTISCVILAIFSAQYGSRGGVALSGFISVFLLITAKSGIRNALVSPAILLLIIIAIFATGIEILNGTTFSAWQFFRSHMWTIITLISIYALTESIRQHGNLAPKYIYDISSILLVALALLVVIELSTSLNVAPAYIDRLVESDVARRLYVPGHEIGIAFIPYAIYKRHFIRASAMIFLLFITAGKTTLVVTALATCYGVYIMPKRDKLTIFSSIAAFSVGGLLSIYQIWQRFVDFFDTGDTRRFDQIIDGWSMVTSNLFRILFGIGLATPYSEGYFAYNLEISSAELTALHENAMYDLENGYMFILLRFGVIGSAVYFTALYKKYFDLNLYALFVLVLWWTSSSAVGSLNVNLMVCLVASGYLLSIERAGEIPSLIRANQRRAQVLMGIGR
jgi:hypothetical protein